ncbi:hypothetical protein BZG81_11980 [Salinivibrio sp. MA607]|nr:hypothetical protein BZG81_11980 [Salinivibrio sp. MA607]
MWIFTKGGGKRAEIQATGPVIACLSSMECAKPTRGRETKKPPFGGLFRRSANKRRFNNNTCGLEQEHHAQCDAQAEPV